MTRQAPIPAAAPAPSPRQPALTYVEVVHQREQIERWIRFGRVVDEYILSRQIRFQGFAPGSVFAYLRWSANDFGTVVSRVDILQAARRGEAYSTVPGVLPGAVILLRLWGWPKVEQVLRAFDAIEAVGIDPPDVAPDHWRHLHHRLTAGQPFHPYTAERHTAWLQRRDLLS